MKVARVNGQSLGTLTSVSGLGGTTPIPGIGDLDDVDLGGIADGDTLIWDDATDTWVPIASIVTVDDVRDAGRWEVLMVPGVTSPPDPIQTAAGDDWVYGWVPG